MNKKYDEDYKFSVIEYYRNAKKIPNAKAFRDIIKRFGLNHQTLSRWIHEYESESMDPGAPSVRSDLRQSSVYREENARDDYDHIDEWPYFLYKKDYEFMVKCIEAHIRHAGGRKYEGTTRCIVYLEKEKFYNGKTQSKSGTL